MRFHTPHEHHAHLHKVAELATQLHDAHIVPERAELSAAPERDTRPPVTVTPHDTPRAS